MFQLYKYIQTDFLGQIFLELFQFKTRLLSLGHPVYIQMTHFSTMFRIGVFWGEWDIILL